VIGIFGAFVPRGLTLLFFVLHAGIHRWSCVPNENHSRTEREIRNLVSACCTRAWLWLFCCAEGSALSIGASVRLVRYVLAVQHFAFPAGTQLARNPATASHLCTIGRVGSIPTPAATAAQVAAVPCLGFGGQAESCCLYSHAVHHVVTHQQHATAAICPPVRAAAAFYGCGWTSAVQGCSSSHNALRHH